MLRVSSWMFNLSCPDSNAPVLDAAGPYKTTGGDSITMSREAALCCGIDLEEDFAEIRFVKDNLLCESGMSSEAREDAEEDGARWENSGRLCVIEGRRFNSVEGV